jgi:hypothetical protein
MLAVDKKPGRPAGAKREALVHWKACNAGFTMRQAVREFGWTMRDANDTIRRAIERRELALVDRIPQPGCKRPVAVYARPQAQPAQALSNVMQRWAV